MTLATYKPVRLKYAEWSRHYSPTTDHLIKLKRIYLFTGATPKEWLDLAKRFVEDGSRANWKYCMMEYEKLAGKIEVETEPEYYDLPELPDEVFGWQKQTGMD